MDKQEIKEYLKEFVHEYGPTADLRANVSAINKMLVKRGRGQELFDNIEFVVNNYKKKGYHKHAKKEKETKSETVQKVQTEATKE